MWIEQERTRMKLEQEQDDDEAECDFSCGWWSRVGFFRVEQEWSMNKNKNEAAVFSCWDDDEAEVLGGLWNTTVRRMKQQRI